MRRSRREVSSAFVHVTQRGVGRRIIFEDDRDRAAFLKIMSEKMPPDIAIVAWCLMDNHMHLLFRGEQPAVSGLMQRVQTSYAQRFNGRHGHVGRVFQGRFSSVAIESEEHLLEAIRYIHRNALEAGAERPEDYQWSSYRRIAGMTPCEGADVCDGSIARDLFDGVRDFVAFHEGALGENDMSDAFGLRPRLSDGQAQSVACRQFGENFAADIAAMPKEQRNKALGTLKVLGLSVRQIERLTGIGRNIIGRAK